MGAICDDSGQVKFDAVLREILNGPLGEETRACHGILASVHAPSRQLTIPLPTGETIYQYRFIKEVGIFKESSVEFCGLQNLKNNCIP